MTQFKMKIRKGSLVKTLFLRGLSFILLIFVAALPLCFTNLSIIDNNVFFFFLYVIIVAVIAIIFQYFVYAFSLGKNITFHNFKNTLLGTDIEHPMKYLFPELEEFYKLEDSIDDKIDFRELRNIATNTINEKKSLQLETDFKEFINQNLDCLTDFDVVIKMKRKGEAIFNDLTNCFPQFEKLVHLTNYSIFTEGSKVLERKILIFDDSIHYGESARNIINFIKDVSIREDRAYIKILYLSIVANEVTLNSLKNEYPESENIYFCQYKIKNEEEYSQYYSEYVFGYLEHINNQIEKDNTSIKIKIDKLLKPNDLKKLLDDKGNYVYEIERLVGKETEKEYKVSLECPWIYEKMDIPSNMKIEMDMVKVRFFVRQEPYINKNQTEILIFPVLVPREFNITPHEELNSLLNKLDEIFDQVDKYKEIPVTLKQKNKDFVSINWLLGNITKEFIDKFMIYFEKRLKRTFGANVIEKNITYPLPNEVYPDILSILQEE